MDGTVAGYLSPGIGKLTSLAAMLPEYASLSRVRPLSRRPDVILGWGLKPTSQAARDYARRHRLPYVALEDGFLRSLGPATQGFQPHSLVVDRTGIYYDASRPSDLETLLQDGHVSESECRRAQHCMALLARHRLSKYNHAADPMPCPHQGTDSGPDPTRRAASQLADALGNKRDEVLVIDQTAGDASIHYGAANADTFEAMLKDAIQRHPDADILVKVHPDVISGHKTGHLADAQARFNCQIIGDDINPWQLFERVKVVHTVTSQLGFEALMAGKQVHCHGLPFYAGWGLTQDRLSCPRRTRKRRLDELFAAAYLRYARYANPYTGEASSLEDTIALIADQKRQRQRLAGPWIAYGFSGWKRRFIPGFLGPDASVRFRKRRPSRACSAPSSAPPACRELVWASQASAWPENDARRWQAEDGFIRSVGLGADLTQPLSLVIDSQGIYYDPTRPSELETLLNTATFSPDLLARAAQLRERLVALKLSKYNLAADDQASLPDGRALILVPGQVESDASIKTGSPQVRTNSDLLTRVRDQYPEACLLYKAHPDVVSGLRVGSLTPAAQALVDHDVSHVDIAWLLERVDSVHTMSSLTGFEALLRGCQVHTHGLPFYAGWGLTEDALHCARRKRHLSLDALVAATLILYPSYVDPRSGQLCHAETVIRLLEQARTQRPTLSWQQRFYRLWRQHLSAPR